MYSQAGGNVIIAQPDDIGDINSGEKTVELEGPFGPSIGPLWWLYYCYRQIIKPTTKFKWDLAKRCPPQLISERVTAFVVDETAIARTFVLWLWLFQERSLSHISFRYTARLPKPLRAAYAKFTNDELGLEVKVSENFDLIIPQKKEISESLIDDYSQECKDMEIADFVKALKDKAHQLDYEKIGYADATRREITAGKTCSSTICESLINAIIVAGEIEFVTKIERDIEETLRM